MAFSRLGNLLARVGSWAAAYSKSLFGRANRLLIPTDGIKAYPTSAEAVISSRLL